MEKGDIHGDAQRRTRGSKNRRALHETVAIGGHREEDLGGGEKATGPTRRDEGGEKGGTEE